MDIIIVSPSLDPNKNVSGISSVTKFIIDNNPSTNYIHFELGKKDNEKGGIFRIKTLLKNIKEWIKLLDDNPNAIIHYNFPLSKASVFRDPVFLWIAKSRKRKFIIHIHGGVFLTAPYIPYVPNKILKHIFSWSVPFIVLSKMESDHITSRYLCSNIHVLPNCIDLSEAKTFKKVLNKGTPLTIGYIGRIAETKGMDYLLNACKSLKNENIPFKLKLAGKEEIQGKYIDSFKNELKENFIYNGVVFGKEKISFLKSLDLFILPSFFEGLPISLLECMSFGVIPITTNVGSIGEVVKNDYNGIFIDIKNSQSIYDKIKFIHYNRYCLDYLSINAQQTIFQDFSPEKYITTLNNIYKSI